MSERLGRVSQAGMYDEEQKNHHFFLLLSYKLLTFLSYSFQSTNNFIFPENIRLEGKISLLFFYTLKTIKGRVK